jgi:signal transduction histidine kinase
MKAKRYSHSLRFRITIGLLFSLIAVLAVTSIARYVSLQRLLAESLGPSAADRQEIVNVKLAAYLRSGLFLWIGSVIAILLITEVMLNKMVVGRLRQFLDTVEQVGSGELDARAPTAGRDEISELAEAFNHMTEELQRRDGALATLNALAATVSQSLNLGEVLCGALDEVLALMRLRAGWITLRGHQGSEFDMVASRGLSEEATRAHAQCNWNQCICSGVFESGQSLVFRLEQQHSCLAAEYLREKGLVCRACVPLKSKNRVLGVMSVAGADTNSMWIFTQDSQDMLTAIGRQIGVAVENASLYEELRQTEMLRRQLMERGIDLQEEERKRIARELHDQTSQRLTSVLMTLGILGESESLEEVQAYVGDLRDAVAQTLEEVHDLGLELRPRLLDDLGLLAALRHYLGEFRDRCHMPVDMQVVGMGDERLPPRVETALYRVAQQALVNVARHAQAHSVGVLLECRDTSVVLIVEDDGIGFDVGQVMGSHVQEGNLGLYGMRERASLLGGTFTVESTPGVGTSIFAEIPLQRKETSDDKDPAAGG